MTDEFARIKRQCTNEHYHAGDMSLDNIKSSMVNGLNQSVA